MLPFTGSPVNGSIYSFNSIEDVFYPEAIETLAQEAFEAGRAECGFECVGAPSLLDQQINDDKELIYTFEVAVYPEVVLGQYKGLDLYHVLLSHHIILLE